MKPSLAFRSFSNRSSSATDQKIIIAKAGKPIAWLAPFNQLQRVREHGRAKGILSVGADFDAPSPPEIGSVFA